MFKQMLHDVAGADIFMVSSFLIFLVFFIAVTVGLFTSNKETMKEISRIPINDDNK